MGHSAKYRVVYPLLAFASVGAIAAGIVIPNLKHFQDKTGAVATFQHRRRHQREQCFFPKPGDERAELRDVPPGGSGLQHQREGCSRGV